MTQHAIQAARIVREKIGARTPKIAIILGSGLGGLADKIENPLRISYADLPGFPHMGVAGHAGEIVSGVLSGVEILAFKGRPHMYETNDASALKTMIRTMKLAGAEILLLSNAAGSLKEEIKVGSVMLITDHINLTGFNPLVGPNDDDFGPRFPSLNDAWDPELNKKLKASGVHEGVYAAFRGPSFETPAEIRMAQIIGASAVGMSSVPECIVARHCGLKVAGISCITNMAAGLDDEELTHEQTLAGAARALTALEEIVLKGLPRIAA